MARSRRRKRSRGAGKKAAAGGVTNYLLNTGGVDILTTDGGDRLLNG